MLGTGGRKGEGRTVAKIKSQETRFDICPFCSRIARPDQIYCTREASGVAASEDIASETVYNRGAAAEEARAWRPRAARKA